jgi:trans-2,3-dihydro-3-hydroxyanthranilate isomerase
MRYRFLTADVFTDRPFGGNPLAVFPEVPPDDPAHTRRLRIFTPARELPFAGHPTVGTAYLLATAGLVPLSGAETRIVFEEGVGPVPVTIRARGGMPYFTQLSAAQSPQIGPPPPALADLAQLLSLTPEDLRAETDPQEVSCGVPFLFIPLRDRAALGRAHLRLDRWAALYPTGGPELYLFTRDPELPGSTLRARMFGPGGGIVEDPATGGAVAALGGYLGMREPGRDGTWRWLIEQGFEMGRPSLLHLEVDKEGGEIAAIRMGGSSVFMSEGTMEVPEVLG